MLDMTLDYHAHILPACDHGSDGISTSLRQIAMAKEAGIHAICATPHFYPHQEAVKSFLRRRTSCNEVLQNYLKEDDPVIELGAEILICEGMEHMDDLPLLCREGTNELLLEMPFYHWPKSTRDTLERLIELEDIQIIIAHAERYPVEDIKRLIHAGVPLQLNTGCLMNPLRRKRYLEWIRAGYVRYLGTDIHMLGPGYREWVRCRKILRN